jgi:hypothetical protein
MWEPSAERWIGLRDASLFRLRRGTRKGSWGENKDLLGVRFRVRAIQTRMASFSAGEGTQFVDIRKPPQHGPDGASKPSRDGWLGSLQNRLDARKRFFEAPREIASSGCTTPPIDPPKVGDQSFLNDQQGQPARDSGRTQGNAPASASPVDARSDPRATHRGNPLIKKGTLSTEEPPLPVESLLPGNSLNQPVDLDATVISTDPEWNRQEKNDRRRSIRYRAQGIKILVGWLQSTEIFANKAAGAAQIQPNTRAAWRGSESPGFIRNYPTSAQTQEGSAARDSSRQRLANQEAGEFTAPDLNQLVQHEALLLDISQTGICLLLESAPPKDSRLWVAGCGMKEAGWSEVTLRLLTEPRPGWFLLRLSFVQSCPYHLFKHVVFHQSRASSSTSPTDSVDPG